MQITTFVEARRRKAQGFDPRCQESYTTRALRVPRALVDLEREPEEAAESIFRPQEHCATDALLTHLAGEVGLALDSWALEAPAFLPGEARTSGLAFDGGRDYTVVKDAFGQPLGPCTDQECTKLVGKLPRSWHHRLVNRGDLVGMDLFDSWCGPGSRHRTVFAKEGDRYRAAFFNFRADWRLGFDLPGSWDPPRLMHWHRRRLIRDDWAEKEIDRWAESLRELTPSVVISALEGIPPQWRPRHWEHLVLRWAEGLDVDRAVSGLRQNLDLYKAGPRPFRPRLGGGRYTL